MTDDDDLHRLDPDNDDVPAELAALAGQTLYIDGEPATFVLPPVGVFGHARRLCDGTAIPRGPGEVDNDRSAWLRPWNQNHDPDEDEESP